MMPQAFIKAAPYLQNLPSWILKLVNPIHKDDHIVRPERQYYLQ